MNSRIMKFAEPPHVAASRQEILGIQARAAAQRAEIDGSMRRFENGIVAFTGFFLLYVIGHLGWAWHRGLLG